MAGDFFLCFPFGLAVLYWTDVSKLLCDEFDLISCSSYPKKISLYLAVAMKLKNLLFLFFFTCSAFSAWALEIPAKHELDRREYRRFVLDNGLKVLLVSDPDMNNSAAAMDVAVGSLSDPKDAQGLAHFLEHMLFLGTRKYPEEGEYGHYLKSRGGAFNAFTAGNHTNYHFEVHREAFEGALDRFAQFFIAPLFNPEFTSREIQAVNNEHVKNLQNDMWRQYQLLSTFFDPEHPENHFGTGNAETLKNVTPATLKAFYERYYSANMMSLVLLSQNNLDWLEAQVRGKFASIENKKREPLQYPVDYLKKSDKLRVIKIQPVKDLRELQIIFALPSIDPYFESQPGTLIGAILGHEGKGSLLSHLKSKNLATGLAAGADADTPNYGSLVIKVALTPEGLTQYQQVVDLCFAAIARLHKEAYPTTLFNELKTSQQLDKVFSARGEGYGLATELATNLNRYPMEWAENLRYSLTKMDEASYRMVLSKLIPQNCLITLVSKDVVTDQTEPIYGTEYSVMQDSPWLEKISKIQADDNIVLPQSNPFMPTSAVEMPEAPVLIVNEKGLKLYYSQDLEFRRPQASFIYRFLPSPKAMSLQQSTARALALACLNEQLNEFSYPATLAGVNLSLANDERGIVLSLSGYNDSLEKLCSMGLEHMKKLSLNDERFEATKENMLRSLKNFSKEPAYQHARLLARQWRQEIVYTPSEQIPVLEKMSRKDIETCLEQLWSPLFIEALVYGNVRADQALDLTRKISSELGVQPLAESEAFAPAYLEWPSPRKIVHAQELDTNNSCFRFDLKFGPKDLQTRMLAELLENFMGEPFYSEMRTRQQLGYIVWSGSYQDDINSYLTFIIQSGTHSADALGSKVKAFLPLLIEQWKALPEDEFLALKKAVKEKLLEKPKTIPEKASQFFHLAFNEKAQFDLNQQLLKVLEQTSSKLVLEALTQCLDKDTEKSITLELYAKGKNPQSVFNTNVDLKNLKKELIYNKGR